jgi:RNA polymerase sigma factor (sigma-70 family)
MLEHATTSSRGSPLKNAFQRTDAADDGGSIGATPNVAPRTTGRPHSPHHLLPAWTQWVLVVAGLAVGESVLSSWWRDSRRVEEPTNRTNHGRGELTRASARVGGAATGYPVGTRQGWESLWHKTASSGVLGFVTQSLRRSNVVASPSNDAGEQRKSDLAQVDRDAMMALAYVLTGSREDAQDVVQNVLTRLTDECASWGRAKSRTRRRLNAASSEWVRRHSTQPDPYGRAEVMSALRGLPHRQRTAVVLRYYLDWDDRAIAEVLGCAPATVRTILSRTLARLRTELGGDNTEVRES